MRGEGSRDVEGRREGRGRTWVEGSGDREGRCKGGKEGMQEGEDGMKGEERRCALPEACLLHLTLDLVSRCPPPSHPSHLEACIPGHPFFFGNVHAEPRRCCAWPAALAIPEHLTSNRAPSLPPQPPRYLFGNVHAGPRRCRGRPAAPAVVSALPALLDAPFQGLTPPLQLVGLQPVQLIIPTCSKWGWSHKQKQINYE